MHMTHDSSRRGGAQLEQREYRERGTGWAGAGAGDRTLELGPAASTRAAAGPQPAGDMYVGGPHGPDPPDGAVSGASMGELGGAVPEQAQPLHALCLAVARGSDSQASGEQASDARLPTGAESSSRKPAVPDGARDEGSGRARAWYEVPPDGEAVLPDEACILHGAPGGEAPCGGKGGQSAGQSEQVEAEGASRASRAATAGPDDRRQHALSHFPPEHICPF